MGRIRSGCFSCLIALSRPDDRSRLYGSQPEAITLGLRRVLLFNRMPVPSGAGAAARPRTDHLKEVGYEFDDYGNI